MKVLLSWLKEFAPFEAPAPNIADDLSELGLSVEEITEVGGGFSGVVVAQVKQLKPHPNADKIQLVEVEIESGSTFQVCCGAFNMSEGDLVPLAQVGAVLPGGMEIGRRKLRGEWSEGMICSASELNLGEDRVGEDREGIMVLPTGLNPGEDLSLALELEVDTLFDLEINPNRPDAMSILGVARDLAAKQGLPLSIPKPSFNEAPESSDNLVHIEIQAPDFCGHFSVKVLTEVKIQPSPAKIANRLLLSGMRPLNNIVDISNYVMLELGHPTHSFDLDKLPSKVSPKEFQEGRFLGVRMAREGETLKTLDGNERSLTSKDGVITNASDDAISIAGVMGGLDTEISSSTTRVAMEAAWWKPIDVARTSRRMNLRSEASARFERGVDTELAELALNRIAELASQQGAKAASGISVGLGNLPPAPKLELRISEIERQLGIQIDSKKSKQLLESIGFEASGAKESLMVQVPSFRLDVSEEIDLIEEVARVYGYSNIPRSVPRSDIAGGLSPRQIRRRQASDLLRGFGFSESISLPFLAPESTEKVGLPADNVSIINTSIAEESVLRSSLRPGILKSIAYNTSHQNYGVWIFEIGKVFEKQAGELPKEEEHLAAAIAGEEPALLLASYIKAFLEDLGVNYRIQNQKNLPGMHPVRGADILIEDSPIGNMGEVDREFLTALNISEQVAVAEINLGELLDMEMPKPNYLPPSKYPATNFDLAFWASDEISADDLKKTLVDAAKTAINSENVEVSLFDVFRNKEAKERSLAYRLKLQAPNRTLNDEVAGAARQSCIQAAEALGATPRI